MSSGSYSENRSSLLQSPEGRKEILRKIIVTTESLQDSVGDNTIQTLESCMEETDTVNSESTLEEKLHHQEEVLLDSEVMTISSKILKKCTHTLTKPMGSYNQGEFADKLIQYVKNLSNVEVETPDWSMLENQVTKSLKITPSFSTLLGTLTPLEKKEIVRKAKAARDIRAEIRKPENVVTVAKEEDGPERTVKIKEYITRYYKTNRKPLDFFRLVLHPHDFGKTIENILQISFLVRDGKVKIMKDSSGILVVQPLTKDMIAQTKAEKTPNLQNVLYLNMEQWECFKSMYRLEKPMIEFDEE